MIGSYPYGPSSKYDDQVDVQFRMHVCHDRYIVSYVDGEDYGKKI